MAVVLSVFLRDIWAVFGPTSTHVCHVSAPFAWLSLMHAHPSRSAAVLQAVEGLQLADVHGSTFWRFELRFSLTKLERRVTYSFAIRELAGLMQSQER